MHRFWHKVIRPVLEAAEPGVVVEVGAGSGAHTRRLEKFCRPRGITLHSVDPAPRFEPFEIGTDADGFVFHRGRSLDVLPDLEPVDVALIDGDHNWYTVTGELRALQRTAQSAGRQTPLFVCHDACWPYGRRDGYYDPDAVPAEHRQSWARAGIVPGRDRLAPHRGINGDLANAEREGGPRNGVLTAIEDFKGTTSEGLELTVLPVVHGLAILVPRSRLDGNRRLARMIARWETAEGRDDLARLAEADRQRLLIGKDALKRRIAAGRPQADQ